MADLIRTPFGVIMLTETQGVGDYALAAAPDGYRLLGDVAGVADGQVFGGAVFDGWPAWEQWERGWYRYRTGPARLERLDVKESTDNNDPVDWPDSAPKYIVMARQPEDVAPLDSGGRAVLPAGALVGGTDSANLLKEVAGGTFSPGFAFSTPGDLNVNHESPAVGNYVTSVVGDRRIVIIWGRLDITITHTTAAGAAFLTSLPIAVGAVASHGNAPVALSFSIGTSVPALPSGTTQFFLHPDVENTRLGFRALGGASVTTIGAAQWPTGQRYVINFSGAYGATT